MFLPENLPACDPRLHDLDRARELLSGLAGQAHTSGVAALPRDRFWYDLLFVYWCWLKDGRDSALQTHLESQGVSGQVARTVLGAVIDRPLGIYLGRTLEAAVYAAPMHVWTKSEIVGRLRLLPDAVQPLRGYIARAIGVERAFVCGEILPLHALRAMSPAALYRFMEGVVVGRAKLPNRPSESLTPGVAWEGVFIFWVDAQALPGATGAPACVSEALRLGLAHGLPEGAQFVLSNVVPFHEAAFAPRRTQARVGRVRRMA